MDHEPVTAGTLPDDEVLTRLRSLCAAYATSDVVRTVAVVGNAPLPPSDERADLIDSSDLVIRVNGFALDSPAQPRRVGVRSDVVTFTRGVRATPWLFRDYRDRLYLLVEPGRVHWEPEILPDWWPRDLGFVPVPNREIAMPLSDALGFDLRTQARWATTGTLTAWLARSLFPTAALRLAGFSMVDQPEQSSWTHAYGEPCAISPEHLLERESTLLRGWIDAGDAVLLR